MARPSAPPARMARRGLPAWAAAAAAALAARAAEVPEGSCGAEDEGFSALQRAHAVAAERLDANASQAGGPRRTMQGCPCDKTWASPSAPDTPCRTYCCNPDNDPGGDWCITADRECQGGRNWGTCAPLDAAGGGPAPSVPATPAPSVPTTVLGCECSSFWISAAAPETPCETYCCNPDNDPGGDWCITVGDCNGLNWGTCTSSLPTIPTAPPPSTTTTTTTALPEPRVTVDGCPCAYQWTLYENGVHLCEDYCCNPDDSKVGDWCITLGNCAGQNWGYCAPPGGAAPVPTPPPIPAGTTTTPQITEEPTPAPVPSPSGALVVHWGLAPAQFAQQQRVEEYPANAMHRYLRRCSTFELQVRRVASAGVVTADSSSSASLAAAAQAVLGAPTNKPAVVYRPTDPGQAPGVYNPDLASAQRLQEAELKGSVWEIPDNEACDVDAASAEACGARAAALKAEANSISIECGLPVDIPAVVLETHLFCAEPGSSRCKGWMANMTFCLRRRRAVDAKINGCLGCVGRHELLQQGVLVTERGAGRRKAVLSEEETALAVEARARKRLARQQQRDAQDRRQHLQLLSDLFEAPRAPERPAALLSDAGSAAAGADWPELMPVAFEIEGADRQTHVLYWSARRGAACAAGGPSCTYEVSVPCDEVVGPGTLRAGFSGQSGQPMVSDVSVLFNPYAPEDIAYAGSLGAQDLQSFLGAEEIGIWQGSFEANSPMKWSVTPFDPVVLQGVAQLMKFVPREQRGSAVRVARWLSYLVNDKVLWGRWNEPYSDGTAPWEWTGSRAIYQEYLQTGTNVKYAQCWVFAGVLVSATRAMGLASLVVTNFRSAHGRRPYNEGIDDFFFYNEFMEPTKHGNSMESIWNFHVWNQVFMRRPDLAENMQDTSVDGWQVIDATPQEQTCEERGSLELCRYALGPIPVKAIKAGLVDTDGKETPYNSVNAGLSYDGMFTYTEMRGQLRGWLPAERNFQGCPALCLPQDRGDGYCDEQCNRAECDFDMGDCCERSCNQVINGLLILRKYECGSGGYNCKGQGKGWKKYYNNTDYIGKDLSTMEPGSAWWQRRLLTKEYKPFPW